MGSLVEDYPVFGHGQVFDIGGSDLSIDIRERLFEVLCSKRGATDPTPALPDELLYDDKGSAIWADIIKTAEFYQTHDEIEILKANGTDVIKRLTPGVTMIDLGAGDTTKVQHFLAQFSEQSMAATYLALDISRPSLEHNIQRLVRAFPGDEAFVACNGLLGTFNDGKEFVRQIMSPRLFLSFGSVLCNDDWDAALSHLKSWADELRPVDYLLMGMDGHLREQHSKKIWRSYHTRKDLYEKFFRNGMDRANKVLGEQFFNWDDWKPVAALESYVDSCPVTRHSWTFKAQRDLHMSGVGRVVRKGDEFEWFDSHKYGEEQVELLCALSGLEVLEVYRTPGSEFREFSPMYAFLTRSNEVSGQYLCKIRTDDKGVSE